MTEEYWVQKDGTKIAVGDMSLSHLQNTLRFILRKNRESKEGFEKDNCRNDNPDNYLND